MTKNKIKVGTYLYPLPVVIVGAKIGEKANFMTVAYCGIVESKPPMISISASNSHHTNEGIRENQTFSVNIPSEDMVAVTDYIGMKSGKDIDKSSLFEIFYGDLKTAPMIEDAPINLECKVAKTIDMEKGHEIFIGEIVGAYSDDKYYTDGILDIQKIKPLIYSTGQRKYLKVGELISSAWSIGHDYKKD